MHELVARRAGIEGLLQRIEGQIGAQRTRYPPADDVPREDINDKGDVDEAAPGRDVGQIRDPELIGTRGHKLALDQVGRPGRAIIGDRSLEPAPADGALQPHLPHQSLDRAAGDDDAFPAQLLPDFAGPVHGEVLVPDPLDLSSEPDIALGAARACLGMGLTRLMPVIGGRGDREDLADRLDPVRLTMRVDEGHHSLGRRSSSACAKNAEAFRRISLARRSSRTSRSSSFIRARSSVGNPGRRPVSRSAWRTQWRSVSAVHPIFVATDRIAAHCESC